MNTTKILGAVQARPQGDWVARPAGNPYKLLNTVQYMGDTWQLNVASATDVAPAAPTWINLTNMGAVRDELIVSIEAGLARKRVMPMPINKNAFLIDSGAGALEGYGTAGAVTIEAVSPNTKAFEGPYLPTKPADAVDDEKLATGDNPFWFGVYNCGPRMGRGGLANGWGSAGGGNILKVTKPAGSKHYYNNRFILPIDADFHRNSTRFKCWMYVAKGSLSGYDLSYLGDGGVIGVPSAEEWHLIDVVIGQSEVTGNYFSFSITYEEEAEIYIAMPNIFVLERDKTFINNP